MRAKILCVLCVLGLMFSFGTGSSSWADTPTVTPLGQNFQPATPIRVIPRSEAPVTPLGQNVSPVTPIPVLPRSEVPVTPLGQSVSPVTPIPVIPRSEVPVTPLGQDVSPVTPIPVIPRSEVPVTPLGGSFQPAEPVDNTMEFAIERVLGNPDTGYYSMDPVQARYVTTLFPDTEFCGVYFEQWPLQVEPPEGMALSNVFYMNQGDPTLYYLTRPAELRKFFKDNWPVVGAGAHHGLLKDTAKTWLRLSQEFSQDGFYTFSKPVVEVVGSTAYGMVEVLDGGSGYLWVTITTGATGSLSIVEDRHIHRGIRPLVANP